MATPKSKNKYKRYRKRIIRLNRLYKSIYNISSRYYMGIW